MKPKIRRKLAAFLAVCMTVSLMPELTWADTGGGGKTVVITEFKPLAEDIAEQEAPLGTRKSELNLPSKLKAVGYEQGAEDENDPPATDSSVRTGEDDTEPTPRALTVTGVKWESDEPYDETAAGETFTFTAVLPKRYVLEGAELPEIVVTLSEELKNNSKKATDSDATDSDVDLEEFAITKQPHDVYSLEGKAAAFSVTATGVEIAYQWQKGVPGPEADGTFDRDSAETDAFTWSDIDGACEAEYRFEAEEEDLTRNVYRCVLTCGEEKLTTNAAKVKRMMMRTNSSFVEVLNGTMSRGTYATLQEAITAAKDGYTLKLLKDINLESTGVTIDGDRNLTLDLGANTITYGEDYSIAITLTGSASLTVTGTTGGISVTGNSGRAIHNTGSGSVSIEGGTVSAAGFNSYTINNVGTGNVSVTGGTVSAGKGDNAIFNREIGNVSVTGGTVLAGADGRVIWNYGTGSVSVEGGTVSATGEEGIAIRNDGTGKITINGNARITSETTPDNGGTIYLSAVPTDAPKTVLKITGGEVENTAADGYAVYFKDNIGVTSDNVDDYCEQTGGTVTGKIHAEPTAVQLLDSSGQSKGIPTTLRAAITAAADGETLKLLEYIDLGITGVTIDGDRSLTLDLGDQKITYAGTNNAITLTGSASLTVIGNAGKILAKRNNGTAIWNTGTGSVSVAGGIVSAEGNKGTAITNYGTGDVSVAGGTVSTAGVGGRAIRNAGTGKITIKGNARITSAKTPNNGGTIYLAAVPAADADSKIVLEILGGTVENTAAAGDGYAVYFADSAGVTSQNLDDYYKQTGGTVTGKIHPEPMTKTETYPATVTVNRDGNVWADHNKTVKLKETGGNAEYANGASVPNGTYQIIVDGADTNQILTVNGAAVNAQIDYYTVTFYDGTAAYGSGTAQQPQTVLKNGKAVKPASDPVKTGFSFAKWVTAAGGTAAYDFENTAVTQKTAVYANWTSTGQTESQTGKGDSSGSSGRGSSTTAQTTTTQTTTAQTGDGGSLSTTTTTSTDHSGKKTTVTTEVAKDAAGNVTGSATTVTTDNITTQTAQGSAGVTVKPDAAAISSAAAAAGATMINPMDLSVAIPGEIVAGELQKLEVTMVNVEVILPKSVADNPAVQTAGVTVEKETMDAARQTGKNVTVTLREDSGALKAVWSFDGQAMQNTSAQSTELKLGVNTVPVQSGDPIAALVKSPVAAAGQENGLVISLTAEGTLPAPAKLTVPAAGQTGITAGSTVILYRYDQNTGALSAVPGGIYLVDANGNVTVDIPAGTRTGAKETYVLLPAQGTLPAGTGTGTTHTIGKGDTLNRISEQYGCRIEDLLALNPGVDIYNLQIGSELTVPAR